MGRGQGGPNVRAWRRLCRGGWVALAATTVLLAQLLIGAAATSASAATVQLDSLGLVICSTQGAEGTAGGSDPAGPHHLPDCCLAGCTMAAPIASPPEGLSGGLMLPPLPSSVAFVVEVSAVGPPERGGTPAKPRAPPIPA